MLESSRETDGCRQADRLIAQRRLSRCTASADRNARKSEPRDAPITSTVLAYGSSITSMEEPRIVGGSVALDLINTVAPRPATAEATDWLDSPPALLHWACRVGLISESEAGGVSSAWATEP